MTASLTTFFGLLGALQVLAFVANRLSKWTLYERQVATLLIPRGLITAVLALDAVRAMKPQLDFLTPLAFAIILLTNVLVLFAAIRAKDLVPQVAPAAVAVQSSESFPA